MNGSAQGYRRIKRTTINVETTNATSKRTLGPREPGWK